MKMRWQTFGRHRGGGVLIIVGLAAPVLSMAVAATVEYGSLVARRSKLQLAVDSAALTGGNQLRLANTTDGAIDSVVKATVGTIAPTPSGSATTVTSAVLDKRSSVQVSVSETVPTVMGKLLSMPTMQIFVSAKAKISGTTKLCLLATDPSKDKALNLDTGSSLTANGCAVYSNSTDKKGFSAGKSAAASAAMICSAGGVDDKGAKLSPSPIMDCPVLDDPLAKIARPAVGGCTVTDLKVSTNTTLYPGVYCKGLEISGTAQAMLMPGIYVFDNGPLVVKNSASLTGQNVGFFFIGDAGGLRFDPNTSISITAPKDGQMAGLLFFEDRTVSSPSAPPPGPNGTPPPPPYGSGPMRQYQITSNNASTLLGTIYLPTGRLIIDATKPVADRSAYTVIVTKQLDLNSGPNLYLNSDYGASDIPVPDGVGPKSGTIALTN